MGGHGFSGHRRVAMEKRQLTRVVITTTIERAHTTVTTIATIPTFITRKPADEEDEEDDNKKPTTTPRAPPASASGSAGTTRPTASVTRASSTEEPSSTAEPSSTSTLPSSTVSSTESSSTTDASSSTIESSTFSASVTSEAPASTSSGAVEPTGGLSGGEISGIVVGSIIGAAALAAFVWFVVGRLKKRKLDKEVWDASKFRRSALMLPNDKPTPRPPSMIERRAMVGGAGGGAGNALGGAVPVPPGMAYPYSDTASVYGGGGGGGMAYGQPQQQQQQQQHHNMGRGPGTPQPYGAANPYGAAPIPYSGQNMYGQGAERGYGNMSVYGDVMGAGAYGAGVPYNRGPGTPQPQQQFHQQFHHQNSLAPFAGYPNVPPTRNSEYMAAGMGPQMGIGGGNGSIGAGSINMGAGGSMAVNHGAGHIQHPFQAEQQQQQSQQSQVSRSASSGTSDSSRSMQPREKGLEFLTRDEPSSNEAPPPAYEDDGTYNRLQRDVKTPVASSANSGAAGSASAPAGASTSSSAGPAPAAGASSAGGI